MGLKSPHLMTKMNEHMQVLWLKRLQKPLAGKGGQWLLWIIDLQSSDTFGCTLGEPSNMARTCSSVVVYMFFERLACMDLSTILNPLYKLMKSIEDGGQHKVDDGGPHYKNNYVKLTEL